MKDKKKVKKKEEKRREKKQRGGTMDGICVLVGAPKNVNINAEPDQKRLLSATVSMAELDTSYQQLLSSIRDSYREKYIAYQLGEERGTYESLDEFLTVDSTAVRREVVAYHRPSNTRKPFGIEENVRDTVGGLTYATRHNIEGAEEECKTLELYFAYNHVGG